MSLTFLLTYRGENGGAVQFVQEMETSGIAETIRQRSGNLRYEYFISHADPEVVLLVDSWATSQLWTLTMPLQRWLRLSLCENVTTYQ